MPLYAPVDAPRPQPPQNGLLVAAQTLGFLTGTLTVTEADAPTQPPEQGASTGGTPDTNITAEGRQWHEVGGVSFLPYPCSGGGTYDPCDPAASPLLDPTDYPAGQEVAGFPAKFGVECTAQDPYTRERSREYAARMLEVRQHYIVGREFWRGEQAVASGWPNTYLADAANTEVIGVGLSTCGALAALEEAISGVAMDVAGEEEAQVVCGGARGIIHASPALAVAWARDYNVIRVGNVLYTTATGTPVITGPGYDGTGPGYSSPEETTEGDTWAYATGWMDVRLGPAALFERAQSVTKTTNVYTQWAERPANVAVDDCCVVAVQAFLGDCSTESGTGTP